MKRRCSSGSITVAAVVCGLSLWIVTPALTSPASAESARAGALSVEGDFPDDGFVWESAFFGPGLDGNVMAAVIWDDGSGPALYVGGEFMTAGAYEVSRIARWDGSEWAPLTGPSGTGVNAAVGALAVFDGALIVAGSFTEAGGVTVNRIARWDGSEWSPLSGPSGTGMSGSVLALSVFDGALIAGGRFVEAGGVTVNRIARWDGSEWSSLGSGVNFPPTPSVTEVSALTVFDGELIAGGTFTVAGGVTANLIASWDGSDWSPLGSGMNERVFALSEFGGELIAGGLFTQAGGMAANRIARWDGDNWSVLTGPSGEGVNNRVDALTPFDGTLIVGGRFAEAGGLDVNRIARWDGDEWSALAGPSETGMNHNVLALAVLDEALIAGGQFDKAGGEAVNHIARWDGMEWSLLAGSLNTGVAGSLNQVNALTVFDGALIVGGSFTHAGGVTVNNIARWDGETWSSLGTGTSGAGGWVQALTVYDGDLIVGGSFNEAGGVIVNRIARWNGSEWSALGSGTNGSVVALAVFDGDLIVGGSLTQAGGAPANHIARWDGTEWSPLGTGMSGGGPLGAVVQALAVFDGALIAGGEFIIAGGEIVNHIARWDGNQWSPLGTGVSGASEFFTPVVGLTVFDGALIAGGSFIEAGGVPADLIARWDGGEWSPLGTGLGGGAGTPDVRAFTVFDDALIAAGRVFTEAGEVTVNHIARWDGSEWSPLAGPSGIGVNRGIFALVSFDADGGGPSAERLTAGGAFTTTGGVANWRLGFYSPLDVGAPELAFDPSSLDFGDVEVGTTSPPQAAMLQNTGDADATGLGFDVPGMGFDVDTSDCGTTLPASDACQVSVTFTPPEPGSADATLEVSSNEDAAASLDLTGNGGGPPVIDVDPDSLSATLPSGETESQPLTIANLGEETLEWEVTEEGGVSGRLQWRAGRATADQIRRARSVSGTRQIAATAVAGVPIALARAIDQALAAEIGEAVPVAGGPWEQEQKLTASDGAVNDVFGISVTLDSDTALVGAVLADVDGNNSQGAAYVFGRSGDEWVEQAKLTAADGAAGDQFGFAVALDGDTAIVAAPLADVGPNADQGAAWIFTRTEGSWSEQAKLVASDGAAGDQFGISATVAGDTAIVGAWFADVASNSDQGAAWVFTRSGETWSEEAKLTVEGGLANDRFGYSVAVEGDTALVGALQATIDGNASQGAAYVFTRSETTWTEETRLTASDGAAGDNFGISVTLDAGTAGIGAPSATVGGNAFRGAIYVFAGASWVEEAKLIASDGVAFDQLGWSVELDGDVLLASAPGFNSLEGAAYVFTRDGATWSEEAKLIADDGESFHEFGFNVALDNDRALVGASRALVDGNFDQGAAYTFIRDGIEPEDCTLPDWVSADPTSGSVPGGGEQTVDVIFDATGLEPDDYEANLCLSSNDPEQPLTLVPLALTVTGGIGPVLTFDPSSLDFGSVVVGTPVSLTATLTNTGDADATGLTAGVDPPDNGFDADISACGSSLPAGESCTVGVTFTPVEPGPAAATLEVNSDEGASALVQLMGEGVTFGSFDPFALEVDPEELVSDGNGVFEPGEVVEAAPTWHNNTPVSESLAGTASDFTGPEGALYTLVQDDADYGVIEAGQSASCLDTGVCYQLDVDDPAMRPATHWEATFDETLSDTDATTKNWTLHIGDSFTDVPRTNLFYSPVETLLHHGVTGGCTDTEYCPTASNTRDQMPVFVLRALEGADYTPPACVEGAEVFHDVAAGNVFCPWIEELANRGVVSGCGGDNYCPNAPVTRAQMAIFLLRSLEGADYEPPACTGQFVDVPCPSLFADWIEELFAREITGGCSSQPMRYCPANPVNREQMAAFVSKAFSLILYGP